MVGVAEVIKDPGFRIPGAESTAPPSARPGAFPHWHRPAPPARLCGLRQGVSPRPAHNRLLGNQRYLGMLQAGNGSSTL